MSFLWYLTPLAKELVQNSVGSRGIHVSLICNAFSSQKLTKYSLIIDSIRIAHHSDLLSRR